MCRNRSVKEGAPPLITGRCATYGTQQSDEAIPAPESSLVTPADIVAAMRRLRSVAVDTPLVSVVHRPTVLMKAEVLQQTGSFKFRGAYNAIASLTKDQRAHGVVAFSSGNHGLGIARAARLLDVEATVVMPENAPLIKREGVLREGARLELVEPSSVARETLARRLAEEQGLTVISGYDQAEVIAGQGTIGFELMEQLRSFDIERGCVVFIPVGGGGLASGVAVAMKALAPSIRIIGVEPALAADARQSYYERRPIAWPARDVNRTIADGQRLTTVGSYALRHLLKHVDDMVTVEEDEIIAAMQFAASTAHLTVEPSGATSLAAALSMSSADGYAVAILSGGNVDLGQYAKWVGRPSQVLA